MLKPKPKEIAGEVRCVVLARTNQTDISLIKAANRARKKSRQTNLVIRMPQGAAGSMATALIESGLARMIAERIAYELSAGTTMVQNPIV